MIHALAAALLPSLPLADLFVDVNAAGCGTGDGSAAAPVCSITDAIGLAVPGDTIRIAPGTYAENVSIQFDLELIGTGGEAVTIVDGGGLGSVITIPAAVTVSIDGLSITNGRANYGAGILCNGSLLLTNSTVHSNSTIATANVPQGGAGIGTFGYGNGVSAEFEIENCVIRDNTAVSENNAAGGGVFLGGGSLTLTNTTIHSNRVNGAVIGWGGGIFAYSTPYSRAPVDVVIQECAIRDNRADSGNVYGSGGGAFVSGGSFECDSSTLSGNFAQVGGGLEVTGTLTLIRNTTISGNTGAQFGGGISVIAAPPGSLLSSSTITLNASPIGSGIVTTFGPATFLGMQNTIVAQNFYLGSYGPSEIVGPLSSLGHNLLGIGDLGGPGGVYFTDGVNGDQVGSQAAEIDALLAPLADNGSTTGTHALLPGSPALDKGSNAIFELFDQRGVPRPQGVRSDIGAFELEGTTVSFCNGDGGNGLGCTDCPCGNNAVVGRIGGCLNSLGLPARLEALGSASVSLPPGVSSDLRFSLVGALPLTFGILISSDTLAPNSPANPCFGLQSGIASSSSNGLSCLSGGLQRHGTRRTHTNGTIGLSTLPWGGEAGPFVGIAQSPLLFAGGETRYFQVIYRDEALGACASRMNSSQAVEITFTP